MRIAPIKGLQGSNRQYTCLKCGCEWKTNRYNAKGMSDCPKCGNPTPHDGTRKLKIELWDTFKQNIYQRNLEHGIVLSFDELVEQTKKYMEMMP